MRLLSNVSSKNIFIAMIVIIILSLVMSVFMYFSNPKLKFMRVINNEYKSLVLLLENIRNKEINNLSQEDTITSFGDVSFDLLLSNELFGGFLSPLEDIVNDFNINYHYASDLKNNKTYIKFGSLIDKDDFIDFELYQTDTKKYIYLNDIYDKYIESESVEVINSQNNQIEDSLYLIDKMKISLLSALKTSDFKSEKTLIDVNNQIINADKLTLKITDKRLKEIIKKTLEDIKDDKKAMSILDNFSNHDVDFSKKIDDYINALNKEKILIKDLSISIFTEGERVAKLEVYDGELKTIEYLSYFTFYPVKKVILFDEFGSVSSFVIELKEDNHLAYEISYDAEQVVINGSIIRVIKSSMENNTWLDDVSFELKISSQNDLWGTLKINNHMTTKIGEEVKIVDVTNVIKEEDLTDDEKDDIFSKLMDKIFKILPSIFSDEGELDVL